MYTINQAAARTGLRIPTIRAWERRYGIVEPARTAGGYRLYDDAAIARLIAMRHLIESEGWRPSQAATRVIEAGEDLASVSPPAEASAPAQERAAGASPPADTATDASFASAANRFDVETMERLLDEGFAAQRFESAMEDRIFPALRALGTAWASGDVDVAAEHAATELVRRRLAHYYDAAGWSGRGSEVIVGLPPGGRHELGAFAFAVAARRAGLSVLYLGADVPPESWLQAVQDTRAPVAVLAVVMPSDVAGATQVIEVLDRSDRQVTCAIGGSAADRVPDALGATRLPDSLEAAVKAVEALVDARAARGR